MNAVLAEPRRVVPPVAARVQGAGVAAMVLVALSLTVFLEVLRVLMPVVWAKEPDLGLIVVAGLFPLLFLVPLLAPPLRRLGPRMSLTVAVVALARARLVLDLVTPSLVVAVVVAAVALVALVPVLTTVLARTKGAAAATLGIVVGLALDGTLRGLFATWDRVWRPGVWPLVVTLVLVGTLIVVTLALLRSGPVVCAEPLRGRVPRLTVVGMLLAGSMLFLQSPGYVASSADLSLAWAVAVVVGGSVVALVAATVALSRPSRAVGGIAGVLLIGVVVLCPTATGVAVPLLVVAGQALSAAIVAVALATDRPALQPSMWRTAAGLTIGLFTSFAALVLYQLHYEHPLPFSNVLLVPGVVLVATVVLFLSTPTGPDPQGVAVSWRAVAGLAGAVLVASVGVGTVLGASAASPRLASAASWPLRVMTLNIGMGVSPDGEVDLSAIADEIRSSDADVVVLEEVSRGWPLGGMQDVGGWLQHELGWQQVWAPAADNQFGNLLLSRVRLHDTDVLALPQGSGSMKRSAALARVDVAGMSVLVMGTHLQHRNSAGSMQARQDEMQVLLDAWGGEPNAVLLGDLNPRNPDLVDLTTLTAAGFTTTQGTTRCTQPTSGDNCSDYVFVAPGLAQRPPVQVLGTTSWDHRPVLSTLVKAR